MVRIGRLLKVREMTLNTTSVHKLIVAVRVAGQALLRGVAACQRKLCCVVIEGRRAPCGCRMALDAVLVEIVCQMVWISSACKVSNVTSITVCRKILILIVDMTLCTRQCLMRPCERERRARMGECRRLPCCRRVTRLAVLTEVAGHMIRIHRPLESCQMALHAVRVHKLVVAIGVTCLTLLSKVCPRESELRRAVIECRRLPCRCGMAGLTVLTEIACHVVRDQYRLEV